MKGKEREGEGRGTHEAVDYTFVVGDYEGVGVHESYVVGGLNGWIMESFHVA